MTSWTVGNGWPWCPRRILRLHRATPGLWHMHHWGRRRKICCAVPNSVLFLGRPGVGKTTVIREMARVLADDLRKRVVSLHTYHASLECTLPLLEDEGMQALLRLLTGEVTDCERCLSRSLWTPRMRLAATVTSRTQPLAARAGCKSLIRPSNTGSW